MRSGFLHFEGRGEGAAGGAIALMTYSFWDEGRDEKIVVVVDGLKSRAHI
jgi:hypothetical protein